MTFIKSGISPRKGVKLSKETRKKLSVSHMGKPSWNKGKTGIFSKEVLEKMSKKKRDIPLSQEHKIKISNSLKGRKLSDKNKQKIGLTNKGKVYRIGFHHSEETKRKISKSHKGKKT